MQLAKKGSSLLDDFQEYFELEIANTPEQMEKVFRIRYRVYCEEFGYEEAEEFPSKLESDEFDEHSVHCLVTHKSSGLPAGCVRVVQVDEHRQMPMEKFCSASLDQDLIRRVSGERSSMCEFSRLAVDGAFRRRAGEMATRFGEISSMDCSQREQRTFSLIAISTFIGSFAVSDLIGRPSCFAMMEPFLPRLLRRSGVVVQRVGEDTDYHGMRAPYHVATQDAVGGMPDELRELYETLRSSFAPALSQSATAMPRLRQVSNGG